MHILSLARGNMNELQLLDHMVDILVHILSMTRGNMNERKLLVRILSLALCNVDELQLLEHMVVVVGDLLHVFYQCRRLVENQSVVFPHG